MTKRIEKQKSAFTLGEVLITLAIIGVIAAVTLPLLVKNYQKKVTALRLKQAYTQIQNAINLSSIDNGDISTWTPPTSYDVNSVKDYIAQYYLPYFKEAKLFQRSDYKKYNMKNLGNHQTLGYYYGIMLKNNVLLLFYAGSSVRWLFVDINGFSIPNRVGKDIFVMSYANKTESVKPYFWGRGSSMNLLYNAGSNITEEQIGKNSSGYGCSNASKNGDYSGFYCGEIIRLNNWTIPDDYPW